MRTGVPSAVEEPSPEYSFEDWAKSLFVLNLWLPNIASGAKFQFLYTLLETTSTGPRSVSEVETYEDFCRFTDWLTGLLPDFEMFEDYVPEPDWGDIKYFFGDRFYKIFYGGELESAVDHYYAFEILHTGFDDYYGKQLGRSVLGDLEMCLSVQNSILDAITQPAPDVNRIEAGDFEIPPKQFWTDCIDFLESYSPVANHGSETVLRFTKDLDASDSSEMPKPGEFENRLHTGENCFYFFLKRVEKIYPVMPRRFLSVLFDTWGAILQNHIAEIEKTVEYHDLIIPLQFVHFVRARLRPENMFDMACALEPDERPHPTLFAIALIVRDDLLLFHISTSFIASRRGGNRPVKELAERFASAKALLSVSPVKLGLMGMGKTVQLEPSDENVTLSPVLIAGIPVPTVNSQGFTLPNDFAGQVIHMTQLLGILDEVEDAEELGRFFRFRNSTRNEGGLVSPMNSDLDLFGSFRDSHNVLIAGASNPTFVMLAPHWGSNFRYVSLKRFWSLYPKDGFLENPRGWKVASEEGGVVVFQSRVLFAYYRLIQVGAAELFIQTPADLLSTEQGELTDTLMDSLTDAFEVYKEKVEGLAFAGNSGAVMILFFPASLVTAHSRLTHLRHLVPEDEPWKMEIGRLKSTQMGVRIVFNDELVSERLMDATDRSLQLELFVDVLRQFDSSVPDDNFAGTVTLLEAEKSQANRFRRFGRQKSVSFPEFTSTITPQLRDFKLADKEIAKIANANGIAPGDYEAQEAKERIGVLIRGLVEVINNRVAEFDITRAIPTLISNVDSLTHKFQEAEARTQNSLDQEVDYIREDESGKRKSEYTHLLHEHHYLIEKFVQLQPSGKGLLTNDVVSEILALVERLLHMYAVSDHIHYDIFPSGLHISRDFLANAEHVENIGDRMAEWGKEQAQIRLGMIGTDDKVSVGVDIATYMAKLDEAFRNDLRFSFGDLLSLQAALANWVYDGVTAENTFYTATADKIAAVCNERIENFDRSSTGKLLHFLTLDPEKVLMLESGAGPTSDLPVWEHRKRSNRYGLRPLIKIGDVYYWGAHSLERSGKIWASMTNTHKFPSDITAPTVAKLLDGYHEKYRMALQTKITEIVGRLTSLVEIEVSPSSRGFSDEDIGDIDVLALTSDRKIILNIESKVIDQAYTNKDIKRVSEKIFGRTTSKGEFEQGYLHRVEKRAEFLERSGKELAESIWGRVPDGAAVVSIFVTPNSFWWTKFPPIVTGVHFVELILLEDFLRSRLR